MEKWKLHKRIALAITSRVGEGLQGTPAERDIPDFEKTLIFGVGYAGTIGGLGTLIGTPPNIILAGQVRLLFDMEISFLDWMKIGVPVVIVLLAIARVYLGRVAFRLGLRGFLRGTAHQP